MDVTQSGLALAALAGVGYGLYQCLARLGLRAVGGYQATFMQIALGGVALGVVLALGGGLSALRLPAAAAAWFALAGLVNWGLGVALLSRSQTSVGAVRTGPLLATTPLFGALLAVVLYGELPGAFTLLGTLTIVAGVYVGSRQPAVVAVGAGSPARPGVTAALPGLGTALCWSVTPLLVRAGLDAAPVPLLGVTVGMLAVALTYGAGLAAPAAPPAWRAVPGRVWAVEAGAGVLVGLATWALWEAFARAPVGPVLALALLQVPTVVLLAPLIAGKQGEERSPSVWLGGSLVIAGALLVLLLP